MSIHSVIRSWYFFDAFSISAFMPIGLSVKARMWRSPWRKSYPCTQVRLTGCTIPIPPASDAAATSSGLLHGYIAPQISGTSIPACAVSGVARAVMLAS